jgi:hypothetical protein
MEATGNHTPYKRARRHWCAIEENVPEPPALPANATPWQRAQVEYRRAFAAYERERAHFAADRNALDKLHAAEASYADARAELDRQIRIRDTPAR